mmetsp:Transcript_14245/g.37612  ORF Transcript_14245/g.37612 Transcript_14245/m.37612 type:complete len:232 (-) Transcript_14245:20-715(-)
MGLPFWRNWNTAVATSVRSWFLSGCHFRSSARHAFMRASSGSTDFRARSSSRASPFALAISGFSWFSSFPSSPTALPGSCTLTPLLESLLTDFALASLELSDFRLFLSFFFLFSFFSEEPELELELFFFFLSFFFFFFFLRDRLLLLGLRLPLVLLPENAIALDPACGEMALCAGAAGAAEPAGAVSENPLQRGVLHRKHSRRFTKLRSPHEVHSQSRLLSSSSLPLRGPN